MLVAPVGASSGTSISPFISFGLHRKDVPGGSPVTVKDTYGQNARLTFSAVANQRVSLKVSANLTGAYNWVNVSIKKPMERLWFHPIWHSNGIL